MIFYATKKMLELYEIPQMGVLTPAQAENEKAVVEKEKGDDIFEWGANVFLFEGQHCIQLMNFTSKFSVFLFNIGRDALVHLQHLVAYYVTDMYKDDPEMTDVLKKYFAEGIGIAYDRLVNKSIMSSMVHVMGDDMSEGERFYRFVVAKKLQTKKVNYWINFERSFYNKDSEAFFSGKKFKEVLLARFAK